MRPRAPLPLALLSGLGATALGVSLFLTWSHQLPPLELQRFHGAVLYGIPANPTAWQVYAISAEVLGLLAIVTGFVGLLGQRPARLLTLLGLAAAIAFVIHAKAAAPTNGLLLAAGQGSAARYVTDPATPGPGETVALIGLIVAAAGLALSLPRAGDRSPRHAA